MGPKPKRQADSQTKNTSGQTPTPLVRKRKGRIEFSDNEDNEDLSEDEQDVREEPLPDIKSSSRAATNVPSTSQKQETGYRYDIPRTTKRVEPLKGEEVTVDDIVGPKKKVPPKSLAGQIFTPVFMYQLLIFITCSLLVNYCSVSFLISKAHVSDTSYRSSDKDHIIDIDRKVQTAINTHLDNAYIDGKVQDKINIKLDNAGIDSRVQEALKSQAPKIVLDEVKGAAMTSLLETKISEKSSYIEKSFDSKIDAVRDKTAQFTNLQETIDNAGNDIKDLQSSVSQFKSKQETTETELSNLVANVRVTSSSVDELSNKYTDLLNTKTTKSDDIMTLQKSIEEGGKQLKEMNKEFVELKKTLSETKDQYSKYKIEVKQLKEVREKLAVMQPNMFNKDSLIMAFMILIVLVFVLAAAVYNLYQRPNNTIPGRTGGQSAAKQHMNKAGSHEILRKIPQGEELEPGVCIISFDESRTETHERILGTANIPNCRVQVHVVRRHEHIPNLPRCKVYLMCTEFSERHVIIEEPGKGLGDLHRTTYDAVLKLGGCLVILYTRDPGSRNLKEQSRYNKNIYCVANQPELSVLNQNGRFFSVYDNLNQYQKSELRKQIAENMT